MTDSTYPGVVVVLASEPCVSGAGLGWGQQRTVARQTFCEECSTAQSLLPSPASPSTVNNNRCEGTRNKNKVDFWQRFYFASC